MEQKIMPTTTRKCALYADDGKEVELGEYVWVNNHSAGSPAKATLIGFRATMKGSLLDEWGTWPWCIEIEGKDYWWAHVYSTKQAAINADPMPAITELNAEVARLKKSLLGACDLVCRCSEGPSPDLGRDVSLSDVHRFLAEACSNFGEDEEEDEDA